MNIRGRQKLSISKHFTKCISIQENKFFIHSSFYNLNVLIKSKRILHPEEINFMKASWMQNDTEIRTFDIYKFEFEGDNQEKYVFNFCLYFKKPYFLTRNIKVN